MYTADQRMCSAGKISDTEGDSVPANKQPVPDLTDIHNSTDSGKQINSVLIGGTLCFRSPDAFDVALPPHPPDLAQVI